MKPPDEDAFLTTVDVARRVQMARTTVQRWIDAGDLRAFRTVGGHRRVKQSDLVAFMRKHKMPLPRRAGPGVRLLVVDDEPHFVRAVAAVLRNASASVQVEVAETSAEGLLLLGVHRPDAVLLDGLMDGIDGFAICEQLKRTKETSGVIVVGMSGRSDSEAEFRRAGADAFLRKPFTAPQVLDLLVKLGVVVTPPDS